MENELKEKTEKMDKELLLEQNRQVKDIVCSTAKQKSSRGKRREEQEIGAKRKLSVQEDEEPLSDYMLHVMQKRKKNQEKIKSLGLKHNSPRGKRQKTDTPKKIVAKNTPRSSQKKTPSKSSTALKDNRSTKKKTKKPRKIFASEADRKKIKCPCDHLDISSYKEESDKRYFIKDKELYNTRCAYCDVSFCAEVNTKEAVWIPSNKSLTHFCSGRQKYSCKHGYCHGCYIRMVNDNPAKKTRRCK